MNPKDVTPEITSVTLPLPDNMMYIRNPLLSNDLILAVRRGLVLEGLGDATAELVLTTRLWSNEPL